MIAGVDGACAMGAIMSHRVIDDDADGLKHAHIATESTLLARIRITNHALGRAVSPDACKDVGKTLFV